MTESNRNLQLSPVIDDLWDQRDTLTPDDRWARERVHEAIGYLDSGQARAVCEDAQTGRLKLDERSRRAMLLSFKLFPMVDGGANGVPYRDRMPLKSPSAGVRAVPGSVVRWGSYQAPGVVLMPSFVNIGSYVGEGTMIDTWATVGSCAQVGANVHVSGGVGIGGVLEPAGSYPVVIEDHAFIGSRCMVVDGARVLEGAKLGAGAILSSTTRVFDRETGEELNRGELPAWTISVGASRVVTSGANQFAMPCILVIRHLEAGETPSKLALDAAFREHGDSLV